MGNYSQGTTGAGAGGRNNHNEEDVGLLSGGGGNGGDHGPDLLFDADFDGGSTTVTGNGTAQGTDTAAGEREGSTSPPSSSDSSGPEPPGPGKLPRRQSALYAGPRTPRTPRTPNRVRFDLRPTTLGGSSPSTAAPNGTAPATTGSQGAPEDHHHHARDSFDSYFDIDDGSEDQPLTSSRHEGRVPLLTGIEAPSVTLANSVGPWGSGFEEDVASWAETERSRPKSGLRMAFMNMANSIIGAGIIGQPYAFKQAGLLSGLVLLVGLTVVVDWTIRLIVINSKLSGANSFQGTVEKCFGRSGLIAISVAQWAFAFGGMVAFGVIVGDSIPNVLRAIWPSLREEAARGSWVGWLTGRQGVILVSTLGVSYPLALYRDIAMLAKASTLALVSMAVILVTVLVQGGLAPASDRGTLASWNLLIINDGIFQAIGVISFAFVCHHNSLLIYGSLKTPTIDRFSLVTHISTGVSMIACLLMALVGFLVFGDKTLGNVLNNFPADNTMVNVARLCFGLNMLTTLPLEAFVCREVMLNYYFPGDPFNMNLHLLFTTSLVVSAMVLSMITCDLGTVFELVGATSAAAMAYILPPLCYLKLTTKENTGGWKRWGAWATAGFGAVVMGISILQAVGKMVRGEGGVAQCMA
ncbi:transmembrane amino acid transporter protein-domain-containing protein [Sordaria brevicollis]|uniref:Transmembrane amino acid transporter protein-domain-containing protein n=1 Tax=Sordaria brevicollis TaxID=83679 RepID=A0AAE0UAW8_SORBR|nr:transmembrane amino acid transporter protein-domain-containing protein [Sordaria brevicollis]